MRITFLPLPCLFPSLPTAFPFPSPSRCCVVCVCSVVHTLLYAGIPFAVRWVCRLRTAAPTNGRVGDDGGGGCGGLPFFLSLYLLRKIPLMAMVNQCVCVSSNQFCGICLCECGVLTCGRRCCKPAAPTALSPQKIYLPLLVFASPMHTHTLAHNLA